MIAYDPKSWWGLIFKFHKSDTFRRLMPAMLTLVLFNLGITYIDRDLWPSHLHGSTSVHSLLGVVISLLLVFRTNTAYERWWEGRRLWGGLVNSTRNLALKLDAYLRVGHPARLALASGLGDFAIIVKEHLRGNPTVPPGPIIHPPSAVAAGLFRQVDCLYRAGDLTAEHVLMLNADLTQLMEMCGACERIKKTPIPYSYSLFIKKFIFAYIVSMPFMFVHDFGYWTALFSTFAFYVLGSLELIAEEIEDPFGLDANDLPTDDIAQTIARDTAAILGSRADAKSGSAG